MLNIENGSDNAVKITLFENKVIEQTKQFLDENEIW
jgi:hypothetical protein